MITPQKKAKNLRQKLGVKFDIYLKREDLHPLKSHKGRSLPLMIDEQLKKGGFNFCISSSGNAAIAAALYIKKINSKKKPAVSLDIFIGNEINKEKLKTLKTLCDANIKIKQVSNPKQTAFLTHKKMGYANLRQSTDDTALIGYTDLAKELATINNLSAIFIPTSSGTTAQGIYEGFKTSNTNPKIHIVQTTACHPIAQTIISSPSKTRPSIADAIVDKIAHRKSGVAKAVLQSNGYAWIADDKKIKKAIELISKTEKIKLSPNSALSIAGLMMAIEKGMLFDGPVACLITGR